MKTLVVLKRQQLKNSGSEKIEPRRSKCQQLYVCSNEKGEGLDKFESKGRGEVIRYVSFPLVTLL